MPEYSLRIIDYKCSILLDYITTGEIKISMVPYVQNMIKGFLEQIMSTANTPAAEHLFEVREDTKSIKLTET